MSNTKQQTAVDWLIQQLQKTRDYQRVINEANESGSSVRNVIKQAKEMEKERMIDFANNCIKQIEVSDTCELLMVESPKDLYNETYGEK
jgi:hypothetical protein